MKALVVRQPWATLIALGIKTIETRPSPPNGPMRPDGVRGLPGLAVERGERIAIVAGATPPEVGLRLGADSEITFSEFVVAITFSEFVVAEGLRTPTNLTDDVVLRRLLDLCNERAWPLPLGAVVCTVGVADALPIVEDLGAPDDPFPRLCNVGERGLRLMRYLAHPSEVVTDQLPLGDFTPGRWGWMLSDPRPCDPVPCKGRQGVFELPDDVAGAVGPT